MSQFQRILVLVGLLLLGPYSKVVEKLDHQRRTAVPLATLLTGTIKLFLLPYF